MKTQKQKTFRWGFVALSFLCLGSAPSFAMNDEKQDSAAQFKRIDRRDYLENMDTWYKKIDDQNKIDGKIGDGKVSFDCSLKEEIEKFLGGVPYGHRDVSKFMRVAARLYQNGMITDKDLEKARVSPHPKRSAGFRKGNLKITSEKAEKAARCLLDYEKSQRGKMERAAYHLHQAKGIFSDLADSEQSEKDELLLLSKQLTELLVNSATTRMGKLLGQN